jgi:hypothetical protein
MNMNITSPKSLAITFAFIVYATILLLIMSALPLHAQTNAPAENGTNSPVAVTDSAPASNAVAVTGTKTQKPSSEPSPVRINNTGAHVGGQNPADNDKSSLGGFAIAALALLIPFAPFVMIIAIVAIVFYFKHRRNKMMQETMLALIEKGVPITPELLAQLRITPSGSSNKPGQQPGQSRHRRLLPGLILTGVGTALLITNLGRNSGDNKAGWIVLFIGVAFLIVWFVERKDKNNEQPPQTPQP